MDLKYDGLISIATGRSRKETLWKNKDMLWSKFIQRISKTKRTAETYAEYIQLPKARQDEIKDVGGFVGGTLKEGRRRKEHVESSLKADIYTSNVFHLKGKIFGQGEVEETLTQ